MAILTSPFVDRHGTESAQPATGRRRSLVVDWLAHPQASFYLVLVPAVILLMLGMMMVLSASSVYAYVRWDGDSYYFVKRQAAFLLAGGAMAYVLAQLKPTQLKIVGWLLMVGAMVLQVLTFTPLGYSNNGNTNWVNLGFSWFNIQPSELAKLAIVMWGADIFARKEKLCLVNEAAAIDESQIFDLLSVKRKTLADVLADPVDYRAEVKKMERTDKRYAFMQDMAMLKSLARGVQRNFDQAFAATFDEVLVPA